MRQLLCLLIIMLLYICAAFRTSARQSTATTQGLSRMMMSQSSMLPQMPKLPNPVQCELNFWSNLDHFPTQMEDENLATSAMIFLPDSDCVVGSDKMDQWNFPYSDILLKRVKHRACKSSEELKGIFLTTELPLPHGPQVVTASVSSSLLPSELKEGALGSKGNTFELLNLARQMLEGSLARGTENLSVVVRPGSFSFSSQAAIVDAVLASLWPVQMDLPSQKRSKSKKSSVSTEEEEHGEQEQKKKVRVVNFIGFDAPDSLLKEQAHKTVSAADGTNLARWLATLAPNQLNPSTYRHFLIELSEKEGWSYTEWDEDSLKDLGAGAFVAVSQASTDRDAAIIRIRWEGSSSSERRPLVLVGKGITYDTGGVNLKPAAGMKGMKKDMGGSAVALGSLLALSRLYADKNEIGPVVCWLAVSENAIGSMAYRPDDIVIAADGTSIEVVHTDAEGRMVLADTLAFASQKVSLESTGNRTSGSGASDKQAVPAPIAVLTYATLTGAAKNALSSRYSAVFASNPVLEAAAVAAGRHCGERVWPFPLDDDFQEDLESEVADTLQCLPGAEADHIYAATFLKRFVAEGIPFIMYDLAAMGHPKPLAHIGSEGAGSGITGFGVRQTVWMITGEEGRDIFRN